MTAGTIPGLDDAPTTYQPLLAWVRQVAELTTPDQVVWCDGSDQEWQTLTGKLVEAGTLVSLREKPNSFWCATDPEDAAPLAERTFVCAKDEADAGPILNWMDPLDMKIIMTEHYRGCMTGRSLYVIPYCLGPLTAGKPMLGVEITDSAYVVVSMRIMTRMGRDALALFGPDTEFVRGLHSVGAPLKPGQQDVPWPCDRTQYLTHFPEDRMIWSYGSGHGGNALLGKSHALRIASVIAREEGWLAEHMLILKLTAPAGTVHYLAAAFPAGCDTTTLAMLEPSIPGWQVETLSDDIAWLRFGTDGRPYATNPETGFLGLAPGTGWQTNPNAMRTLSRGNSIFTNVALTDDGDVWWEGYSQAPPDHLTTWKREHWTLANDLATGNPTAHTNAHYCSPIAQCPSLAPESRNPHGVPISAILFGSRRTSTIPLVTESRDWQHGVFLGATLSTTGTTATGEVVRRDPMAMQPYLGYHAGDYLQHWIDTGTHADQAQLPKIFSVNWFRRGTDGQLLWPGLSENARVLKWVIERIEGTTAAVDTPIGWIPTTDALRHGGLDAPQRPDIEAALTVDLDEWRAELPLIEQWFATIGDKLPTALHNEFDTLKHRLA